MKNTLKIVVDVSMYASIESLNDSQVMKDIFKKVIDSLEKKGQKARLSAIEKASKNVVSLLLSKKKGNAASFLSVYIPDNAVEPLSGTVVPSVSSDEDSFIGGDGIESDIFDSQNSSLDFHNRQVCFSSISNEIIKVDMTFEYLADYFKHSLSTKNKPMFLWKNRDQCYAHCEWLYERNEWVYLCERQDYVSSCSVLMRIDDKNDEENKK